MAPILAIQGRDDPYGSLAHIDAIVAGSGARVETLLLDGIGHAPYAEAPDMVIAAVRDFIGAL